MSMKRDRRHDDGLADLPAWGLEIMMGLYGPETVAQALESECSCAPQAATAVAMSAAGFVPLPPTSAPVTSRAVPVGEFNTCCGSSPELAEFAAIDALGQWVAKVFRRH